MTTPTNSATPAMAFFTIAGEAGESAPQPEPACFETHIHHTELSPEEIAAEWGGPPTGDPTEELTRDLRSIHQTTLRGPAGAPGARVDFIHTGEEVRRRAGGQPSVDATYRRHITFRRTRQGLVLMRQSTNGRPGFWRPIWSETLTGVTVGDVEVPATITSMNFAPLDDEAVLEHLGPLPHVLDLVPLLDPRHRDALPRTRDLEENAAALCYTMSLAVIGPWVNAPNAAAVARNYFGEANYRKPLARLVAEMQPAKLAFYANFAGSVPIEHLIEAMQRDQQLNAERTGFISTLPFQRLSQSDHGSIRALLELLPSALCSRLLKSNEAPALVIALRDTAQTLYALPPEIADHPHISQADDPQEAWRELDRSDRNPEDLRMLIDQMGHKRIRSLADLEHLIEQIPTGVKPSYRTRCIQQHQATHLSWLAEMESLSQMRVVNTARAELAQPLEPLIWAQWSDPEIRAAEKRRFEVQLAAQRTEREAEAARAEQERIAAQQRAHAQRAQAHDRNCELLEGATVAGYKVVLAQDGATLSRWGALMGNCIGGYSRQLGLSVFGALIKPGEQDDPSKATIYKRGAKQVEPHPGEMVPAINFQIEGGRITQIMGSRNRALITALGRARAQELLDELQSIGNWEAHGAWGVKGLDTHRPQG